MMTTSMHDQVPDALLLPGAVAALLFVDPKTATRWAAAGRLTTTRTVGGHRRYVRAEVEALAARLRGRTRDEGAPGAWLPAEPADVTGVRTVERARDDRTASSAAAVQLVVTAAARAEQVIAEEVARHRRVRLVAAQSAAHLVTRRATLDATRAQQLAEATARATSRETRRTARVIAEGVAATAVGVADTAADAVARSFTARSVALATSAREAAAVVRTAW